MSDCKNCAEYDFARNYCPKYCEVIRRTLAEITPRWIPVSERLPEENDRYFVTARHKGLGVITTDVLRWRGERWGWEEQSICTVLAWMPLPEPWRGEEECEK